MTPQRQLIVLLITVILTTTGCVRQLLTIETTPPGAHVYFNDRLMGSSPVTEEFLWYEPYHIRVEHPDHDTLQENGKLNAPFWMWFPLDGLMAVLPLPLKDRHRVHFDFTNPTPAHIAAAQAPPETIPTHTGVLHDLGRIHRQKQ
jgi:hypothetical protein